MHLLDSRGGADPERAPTAGVSVADAVQPDDLATGRQVRTRNEAHQLFHSGVGVADQVSQRLNDFDEVVRRTVGGHTHRDAAGSVDQQVGEGRGQDDRLDILAVVVRFEVDRVLVQAGRHGERRGRHPAFGVAHGCGAVIGRTEVAVTVDQRQSHGPGLRGPDQRVVDRSIAVRVVLAHDFAHHAGTFHVGPVRPDAHLIHGVEDPALDGFQAVTGIGQSP